MTPPTRYHIPTNLPPPVASLVRHYANAHGTTVEAILRGCRTRRVGFARRCVIERLRAQGHTLQQIGRWLRLHHTAVMYHLGLLKSKKPKHMRTQ